MQKQGPLLLVLAVIVTVVLVVAYLLRCSDGETRQAREAKFAEPAEHQAKTTPRQVVATSDDTTTMQKISEAVVPKPVESESADETAGAAIPQDTPMSAVARMVLQQVTDVSRPLEERQKILEQLGKKGDAASFEILKAIGDARVYLNYVAVESLSDFAKSPLRNEAAAYAREHLTHEDSQIASAAARAWARLAGDNAVAALGEALKANHERPDGHQIMVCTAIVQALKNSGLRDAVGVLVSELQRVDEINWDPEYGSEIIAGLKAIRTPEGISGAETYAAQLEKRIPDDPMVRDYLTKKATEARAIAGEE